MNKVRLATKAYYEHNVVENEDKTDSFSSWGFLKDTDEKLRRLICG